MEHQSKTAVKAVMAGLFIALIVVGAARYPRLDKHDTLYIMDYARNCLENVEKDSLFIACGDASFNAMCYAQEIDGVRPDVIILQRQILCGWPRVVDGWPAWHYYQSVAAKSPAITYLREHSRYSRKEVRSEKLLEDIIGVTIKERPVYIGCGSRHLKTHPIIGRIDKHYRMLPEGLVYRLYPKSQKVDMVQWIKRNEELWTKFKIRGVYRDQTDSGILEFEVPNRYAMSHVALADIELQNGFYRLAEGHYEKALIINKDMIQARNGLGVALACLGRYAEASKQWNIVLSRDPGNKIALKNIAMTQGMSSGPDGR
jgi:tetratricopeptide (TPR) repeat protein